MLQCIANVLKLFVHGKNTANSTAMVVERRLDQIKTDLHDSCANCVVYALSGRHGSSIVQPTYVGMCHITVVFVYK